MWVSGSQSPPDLLLLTPQAKTLVLNRGRLCPSTSTLGHLPMSGEFLVVTLWGGASTGI